MRTVDEYFATSVDGPLIHYKGISSMLGMAGTESLWASNVYYLTDSKEIEERAISDPLKQALKPKQS